MKRKDRILASGIAIGVLLTMAFLNISAYQEILNTTSAVPDGAVSRSTLVSFTDEFKSDASAYWSTEREYAACVEMRTVYLPGEDDAQIQLVFHDFENVNLGSEDRAVMPTCNEKAVIHSHPSQRCNTRLWSGDLPAAEAWYRSGGVAFLIQCAPDKVEVYTRDTGTNGVIITI